MYSFTKLKGFEVITTKPETIGKIKDIIVDSKKWQVKGFLLSKGLFSEDSFCPMKVVKNIDFTEKSVICYSLFKMREWVDERIRPEDMRLSKLIHQKVITEDLVEAGFIFDSVIDTKQIPWTIESIFIDQGLMQTTTSVNPHTIMEITEDGVRLKLKDIEVDTEKRKQFEKIEKLRIQAVEEKMILEKKYSNVNETISNLDMRLNSYRSSIANENEKTLDNRDTIGDIEKKLKRTLNDMKAAKKFVKETEESISEIDKEVVKKKKGAELNQQTKTRLQQLGKERKEKETNLEEMTIQYNDYEKLKDNIDAHVKKLHDEIKQSEKDIDTYQNIISEMGKDIQKRTNEKNDMKKDHIHLEKKVRRLEDNQTHIIMSGSK